MYQPPDQLTHAVIRLTRAVRDANLIRILTLVVLTVIAIAVVFFAAFVDTQWTALKTHPLVP